MREFTMQAVREMKNWSEAELYAYGKACARYADAVAEFESYSGKNPMPKHNGMPNFKKLFKEELEKSKSRPNVTSQ